MGLFDTIHSLIHIFSCPHCGESINYVVCPRCGARLTYEDLINILKKCNISEQDIHALLKSYPHVDFNSIRQRLKPNLNTTVSCIAPSFTEDYTRIPNKHIIPDANPQKERFGVELQINPKISFLSSRDPLKPIKDSASIFAPSEVSKNDFMIVQVFLYPWIEENLVLAKAKDVDPDAVRKNFTPLDVPLKNGDKVTAHLQMSGKGLELSETDIDMIWQDHYTDCQFSVYVPEDYKPQSVVGTVTLSVNGAPAGRMTFKSKIVDVPRLLYAEIVSHKFNKIFISYSHLDEEKVKFIHQAYEALKVDHFFDRAYLKPGDVYPEKIKNYIASADLFILCWSENAKNSDYVQLEIEDAMKRAYPGIDMDKVTLAIYPLDIDPHAELPKEMNKLYNFGRM